MPIDENGAGIWPNLARLANAAGYPSQRQLAIKLGTDPNRTTSWKQGVIPETGTLQIIARHFGVSVGDLLPADSADPSARVTREDDIYPSRAAFIGEQESADDLADDERAFLLSQNFGFGDPGEAWWPKQLLDYRRASRGKAPATISLPDLGAAAAARVARDTGFAPMVPKPTKGDPGPKGKKTRSR